MNHSPRLLFALFLSFSTACTSAPAAPSDAAPDDTGTIDGGAIDGGAIDGGTIDGGAIDAGAIACVTVSPGAAVTSENVAADSPVPTGGAVADGTYTLTAIHAYTGAGGASGPGTRMLAGAIRFAGNAYELVLVERGAADGSAGTFTTSGTQVMLTRSCPASAGTPSLPYEASAGRFDLYLPPNLALTFTGP